MFDPAAPKTFWVFPPAVAGQTVEVLYGAIPPDVALNQVIVIDDIYEQPLIDYILFRAYSKDSDFTGNVERAMAHRQSLENTLGLIALSDASKVKNPNEVRAELNMLPYDGGDEYGVTAASMPVEPLGEPEDQDEPEDEVEPEPDDVDEVDDNGQRIASRRALFSLTYRARKKATTPAAFLTWLDSNWINERAEWQMISSGAAEPQFFSTMHEQLQQVASTATAEQLSAFVETVASNFEKDA
jgi:hypothetical protein